MANIMVIKYHYLKLKGDLAINVYALSINMGQVIRKQVNHSSLNNMCWGNKCWVSFSLKFCFLQCPCETGSLGTTGMAGNQ